jgi:hypothetical protein
MKHCDDKYQLYPNPNAALTTVPKVRLYVESPERKENTGSSMSATSPTAAAGRPSRTPTRITAR